VSSLARSSISAAKHRDGVAVAVGIRGFPYGGRATAAGTRLRRQRHAL